MSKGNSKDKEFRRLRAGLHSELGSRIDVRKHLPDDSCDLVQFVGRAPELNREDFEELYADYESESSFNDDGVPPSEEELFSSDWNEGDVGDYVPPITRLKKILVHQLIENKIKKEDDEDDAKEKKLRREEAIAEFRDYLNKRRAVKAYKRLKKLEEADLKSPDQQAFFLEKLELLDKNLNRSFYYEPMEPKAYRRLLQKRKTAIKRKYELYAMDKDYRDELHRRIKACVESIIACERERSARAEDTSESEETEDERQITKECNATYVREDKTGGDGTFSIGDKTGGNVTNTRGDKTGGNATFSRNDGTFSRGDATVSRRDQTGGNATFSRGDATFSRNDATVSRRDQTGGNATFSRNDGTFSRGDATFSRGDQGEGGEGEYVDPDDDEEEISSFYDDFISDTELEFFSSAFEEDDIKHPGPKSRRLNKFARLLNACAELDFDDEDEKKRKYNKKMEIISEFDIFTHKKRAIKALSRIQTIEQMEIDDPIEEARQLLNMEMLDKKLNRSFYYTEDEPDAYKDLLIKRRNALIRKYELYAADAEFREECKDKAHVEFMRIQQAPLFDELSEEDEENASSFNDSQIPTSEEEFMSEGTIELPNYFVKPITRTKGALYDILERFEAEPYDSESVIENKKKSRLDAIQNYNEQLIDRRKVKASARLEEVKKIGIKDPGIMANKLEELEYRDKKLNRKNYFMFGEPEAFTELLKKRRRAIHRKYEAYVKDKIFRKQMEDRIISRAYGKPIKIEEEDYDDGDRNVCSINNDSLFMAHITNEQLNKRRRDIHKKYEGLGDKNYLEAMRNRDATQEQYDDDIDLHDYSGPASTVSVDMATMGEIQFKKERRREHARGDIWPRHRHSAELLMFHPDLSNQDISLFYGSGHATQCRDYQKFLLDK